MHGTFRQLAAFALLGSLCLLPIRLFGAAEAVSKSATLPEVVHYPAPVALVEGDILTRPAAHLQSARWQTRGLGLQGQSSPWVNGIVHYAIDPNLSLISVSRVQQAIAHWNRVAGISMVPIEGEIQTNQQDYVVFTAGSGCASWVGRQGGMQEVWIASNCNAGSIMHEIGHVLGLEHEHTRPDRDQYIAINWQNVDAEKTDNFMISSRATRMIGDYDYVSIMHYGEQFFSANGQPTIEPLQPTSIVLGQRDAPSAGDIDAIAHLYATDLSLVTTRALHANGNTELSLHVSNQHVQGAHSLQLTIPSAGQQLVAQSQTDWHCEMLLETIHCSLDHLAAGSQSVLVLTVGGTLIEQPGLVQLRSKTPDTDLSNNDDSAQPQVTLAAAMDGNSTALYADAATLSSGGGSMSWWWLVSMGLLVQRNKKQQLKHVTKIDANTVGI